MSRTKRRILPWVRVHDFRDSRRITDDKIWHQNDRLAISHRICTDKRTVLAEINEREQIQEIEE